MKQIESEGAYSGAKIFWLPLALTPIISREVKVSKRNMFKKFEKLATCCKPGCFLHSTYVASWHPVKKVGNLIDLSRHVVIDLSGCQPTKKQKKLRTSWQLVAN